MDAPDVVLPRRSRPICAVPEIGIGNKPIDDGNYLFTTAERDAFIDGAQDRAADGLIRVGRLLEQIEHMVIGIVARGTDLLDDHLLLTVELVLFEQRVLEDVGEDIGGERHVFLEHAGEIAGVLDGSCGIEVAADILDVRRDLASRTPGRALECHVLKKMGNAMFILGFAAGSGFDPNTEGNTFNLRNGLGCDRDSV
mgnify:CR=1 FL=1